MVLRFHSSRNGILPAVLTVASLALLSSQATAAEIRNHATWKDTQGNLIDCHEGGILRVGDTFYWYGRAYKGHKTGVYGKEGAKFRCGLNVYSSTDLVNKGKYIVAGSGVAGLNPTDTTYAVADSPLGPYTYKGLMSQQNTWSSQISSLFYLAESDRLIALCEQWLTGPNGERVPAEQSCQLWLPVTFDPVSGVAKMEHVPQWDPWTHAGIAQRLPLPVASE